MRARHLVIALLEGVLTVMVVGAFGALFGCGHRPRVPPRAPLHRVPLEDGARPAETPGEGPVVQAPFTPSAAPPRAILVTVDGVRWQDVFEGAEPTMPIELRSPEGLLPRTWELVGRSGVALGHGAGCGVVRPRNTTHTSLPGYLEIFTGKRTACMSNVCAPIRTPTILDAAAAAGLSVASISSWEVLSAAAARLGGSVFVSAGTRWPGPRPLEDSKLEDAIVEGERAKPFPALGGTYRPDRYTMAIALEYVRVRRPRLLHVGLGDTDEYGHRDDYAAYIGALRDVDMFLGDLVESLESLDLFGSTTIIVTADHGRAHVFRQHGPSHPESGRSFVVAFGGAVPRHGEVCARHDLWLTDIAPTLRAVLGLSRDTSPDVDGRPIGEILRD